jgi:hypothetical protein
MPERTKVRKQTRPDLPGLKVDAVGQLLAHRKKNTMPKDQIWSLEIIIIINSNFPL